MSQVSRVVAWRDWWRWSRLLTGVVWQSVASPLLMAGLPESRARVRVGPPLLARGPRVGSIGVAAVPTRFPLVPLVKPAQPLVAAPVFWPMRLWWPLVGRR